MHSQASRKPIAVIFHFAGKANIEGYNDVSALFRTTAEGEQLMHIVIWNILSSAVTL
jgi:rubrerythrin